MLLLWAWNCKERCHSEPFRAEIKTLYLTILMLCLFILAASHNDLIPVLHICHFRTLSCWDASIWPCFISADLAATVCLQSLPCENDKLKWYMCGLTCTAQESPGWITLLCLWTEHILSPGGSWGAGLCGASGKILSPTHLSPQVAAPYISARGTGMSFVTANIFIACCSAGVVLSSS